MDKTPRTHAGELSVEPVAWRIRIGDSDIWGYCSNEGEADFHGNASGLKYLKEPLYDRAVILSYSQAQLAEYKRDAERYRWLRDIADPDMEQPCIMIHLQDSWGNWKWQVIHPHEIDGRIDAAMDQTEQKR